MVLSAKEVDLKFLMLYLHYLIYNFQKRKSNFMNLKATILLTLEISSSKSKVTDSYIQYEEQRGKTTVEKEMGAILIIAEFIPDLSRHGLPKP